jgi:hypothetical protein
MNVPVNVSVTIPATLIKQPVGGNVFLIDSPTGNVFSYDPDNIVRPRHIGVLEDIPEANKHDISKTNGCLAKARVRYLPNVRDIMADLESEYIRLKK